MKFEGATDAEATADAKTALDPFVGKTIASISPSVAETDGHAAVCGYSIVFTDGSHLSPWAAVTDDGVAILDTDIASSAADTSAGNAEPAPASPDTPVDPSDPPPAAA